MFGEKKTLPLWRRRRTNFLSLERMLASPPRDGRESDSEHAVIGQKATLRRLDGAKGKIRTPVT
jgi:hypothetical protein